MSELLTSVENAGWLRFGEGIGDHRVAYIDVDIEMLIGKAKHEISRQYGQRLQTANESSTRTYVKLCEEGLIKEKIAERFTISVSDLQL